MTTPLEMQASNAIQNVELALLDAVGRFQPLDARTYLAGQALAGLLGFRGQPLQIKMHAIKAVQYADALLAELAKPKEPTP